MDEFALIRHYFATLTPERPGVRLGVGDDCALLDPPVGETLAVTTDTLVAGRHFPQATRAFDIGWKALAVSVSDLAAMAATPRWFVLALTLPEADESWLAEFAHGLAAMAHAAGIALVGGDTTRGPLSLTITAVGSVPAAQALRRDGARAGDAICVTGTLGDAALALRRGAAYPSLADAGGANACLQTEADDAALRIRLDRPTPRVEAAVALRGLAHAAIDLSDGLAGDLAHVLAASGVGAEIEAERLPMSPAFARLATVDDRLALQAAGGDDYELCFCLPPERLDEARAQLGDLPLTAIGRITAEPGLRWRSADGGWLEPRLQAYRHFGDA